TEPKDFAPSASATSAGPARSIHNSVRVQRTLSYFLKSTNDERAGRGLQKSQMASMRYVRGSGGGRDSARGGPQIAARGGGRGRGGAQFPSRGGGAGRFSGRGRGRFSHSFVRGASAHVSGKGRSDGPGIKGNKWVRGSGEGGSEESKDANATNLEVSTAPGAETSKSSAGDASNEKPEMAATENSSLERRGKHKLVMKNESSETATSRALAGGADFNQSSSGEHPQESERQQSMTNCVASSESTEIAGTRLSSLERRGRHKLVMKHESSEIRGRTLVGDIDIEQIPSGDRSQASDRQSKATHFEGKVSHSWKRQSLQAPNEVQSDETANNPSDELNFTTGVGGGKDSVAGLSSNTNMERRGFGKLVLKRNDAKNIDATDAGSQSQPEIISRKRLAPGENRKSASHTNRRHTNHSGPRRISLVKPSLDSPTAQPDGDANAPKAQQSSQTKETSHVGSDEQKVPSSEKTLTDFCYQNTGGGRGPRRGRGRGRGRSSARGGRASGTGNIGLVRVKSQNPSTTPICPTFRRGLPCNNPKCTLRHDVATEASRPICVFFQRNGMCSKDDCPFRHIKVRWDAEICPTFQRVGYCEDPNCSLRHVVAKKPRIDSASSSKCHPAK
ncbi:hypothetical protein ACHAWF_006370, partial [Thalassiosira exigua]